MRFKEFLKEAPLADYRTTTDSDFDEKKSHRGSFPERDLKLMKHPVHHAKLVKFFSKTPYDFKIIVSNAHQERHLEGEAGGEVKQKDRQMLIDDYGISPMMATKLFMDNKKGITVIFTGNDSDDPMTPWIMAHRLGHAYDDHNKSKVTKAVEKVLRAELDKHYGVPNGSYQADVAFARMLITSRAARTGKLTSMTEAAMELFAEYILRNKIELKPLPDVMHFSVYGKPHPREIKDRDVAERVSKELERQIAKIMKDSLDSMVGKVYIY